jgi:dolichyl-diphosphooligosaccharide--protein glycosyltransferase
MASMGRRAALVFGLSAAAAAVLGVALRLHTRDDVLRDGQVRPFDSDSAYHLRRARFAAAEFPRTILFDPLMNFPEGGVPIWPPLYDAALSLPARVAGAGASAEAVASGAAWVPVVLAAWAILLAGALGRRLAGDGAGVAAAAFLAVCPGHILWTQFGHVDQHAAESFCGLLALVLFLRSREVPDSAGNALREGAAGAALVLAVLTWQGGIYWGAIFALALAVEAASGSRPVLRAVVLTLGLPALVVGAATAAWLGWLRPPMTYVSFGFFQPLFLAALCGGTAGLALFVRLARRRAAADRREVLATLAVVLLAGAATLPFASELFAGLRNGVGYVAGSTREVAGEGGYVSYPEAWLKGIFEARPLLADGPALAWKQLSAAIFLSPLAILVWAYRAQRGVRPGVHGALAIWGSVTLFLALSQRLNIYYAAPLCALTLVEAARFIGARLTRAGGALAKLPRGVVACAAGLVLALPMQKGLQEELAAGYVPGSDLFETLGWMRTNLPHAVDAYDPRLLGPPPFPDALARASSVLAPWSLGHLLLYEAELPVVANNFGYGFLDSVRFFLASTEEEALAIARRHRARWIVATDLVPRMNDYASYLGRPPLFEATARGPVPTAAYFSTMQSRLYDYGGQGAALSGLTIEPLRSIRVIHRSKSAIQRGARWIPRWVVFEILDDAQGRGGAPGGP